MRKEQTKTIAVLNHKGGVGKTTITLNFGAELAKKGYKVLLVDFDSQGNLTKSVGMTEVDDMLTLAEGIAAIMQDENINAEEYICKTDIDNNLDIIPAGLRLANVQVALNSVVAREQMLKCFLDMIKEKAVYDYIIIDNAPSIMIDFQNACVAADEVLIVTEPREYSNDGMESLLKNMVKIRKFLNEKITISGILINKVESKTNMTKGMIALINDIYGDMNVFDSMIPNSVKVPESQYRHQSIALYEKNNPAALAISAFTDEYLANVENIREDNHGEL